MSAPLVAVVKGRQSHKEIVDFIDISFCDTYSADNSDLPDIAQTLVRLETATFAVLPFRQVL